MTMIGSQIINKLNQSLNITNQVASVSHSNLLTSHVEFTASDSKHSQTIHTLQNKYHQLGAGQDTGGHANGQFKHAAKTVKVNQENRVNEDSKTETGMPVPRVVLYNPGRVQLDWKQSSKIGAGLINLGNTCFMNTVIQCLTYCTPLANYLLNEEDHTGKCIITGFCMLCEMQKHMKRVLDRHGQAIRPMYIYQKLKSIAKHFQFGRQEDAHEFLRYVIDNLWKACLANHDGGFRLDPASKETTVVNQIFGGYNRSQVVCLRCHGKSNTFDHFMDLILDIKQNVSSLQSALEKFVQAEMLEDDNAYKCPKCCMKVRAEKKFTVHKPPNVATFQFKRFDYNRMFGGKITKNISYPEKLDLRPYMSDTEGPSVLYKLNSVLVHMGHTCNSGHYFCFVRNSNGCWYLMDDTRVHQVSLDQVLQQQAYVLFYVRVPSHHKDSVKKPLQSLPLHNKVITPVRNGPIDQSPEGSRSMYASRPSALTQNGPSKQSTFKLCRNSPLLGQQSREKISFGIRRATAPTTNGLNSPKASNDRARLATNVSAPGCAKTLVPYGGDSSDSSDEEKSHAIGRLQNGESPVNLQEIPLPSESAVSIEESGPPKETPEHRNRCERLVPKGGHGMNSPSLLRSRGTVNWNVVDSNLQSPSVASGSSNNSINSTTDWSVMDHDVPPKSKERAFVGWSVLSKEFGDKSTESVASRKSAVNGERAVSPTRTNLLNGSASPSDKIDHCVGNGVNEESVEKSRVNGDVACSDSGKPSNRNDDQGDCEGGVKHHDLERKRSWTKPSEDSSSGHKRFKEDRYNDRASDRRYGGRGSQNGWEFDRCQRNGYHFYGYENEQQRRFKEGRHQNRHSSGTSNSSYETEWIEKTKETVDKERRSSYNGDQRKYWNGGFRDDRRRDRGQYKGTQWNGSRNSDTVNELLGMSGHCYGNGVCAWDGNRSYMDDDSIRKRHYSDDYDEEYDKGKMRRERKRYSDPYVPSAGNPFQRIQNMKGNNRPYGNFNNFRGKHNWNHSQDKYYGNRNYGPPRIHRYYN